MRKRTRARAIPSRRGRNNGNGKQTRTQFSRDYQPQVRRGPDVIPRGTAKLFYQTLLDSDAAIVAALIRTRYRGQVMGLRDEVAASLVMALRDPKLAPQIFEEIASRLEGRPVQRVEQRAQHQTIFCKAGTPLPPGWEAVGATPTTLAGPEGGAPSGPSAPPSDLVELDERGSRHGNRRGWGEAPP